MRPIIFIDGIGTIWTARGAGTSQAAVSARSEGTMVGRRPIVTVIDRHAADPQSIKALKHVCKQTAAQLVFFGPWRASQSGAHLEAALSSHGMTAQLHPNWKTDGEGPGVGDEVARWLQKHEGTPGFAIVTGEPLRVDSSLARRVVQGAGYGGIQSAAADIAAAIEERTRQEVAQNWAYTNQRDALLQATGGGAPS